MPVMVLEDCVSRGEDVRMFVSQPRRAATRALARRVAGHPGFENKVCCACAAQKINLDDANPGVELKRLGVLVMLVVLLCFLSFFCLFPPSFPLPFSLSPLFSPFLLLFPSLLILLSCSSLIISYLSIFHRK